MYSTAAEQSGWREELSRAVLPTGVLYVRVSIYVLYIYSSTVLHCECSRDIYWYTHTCM